MFKLNLFKVTDKQNFKVAIIKRMPGINEDWFKSEIIRKEPDETTLDQQSKTFFHCICLDRRSSSSGFKDPPVLDGVQSNAAFVQMQNLFASISS